MGYIGMINRYDLPILSKSVQIEQWCKKHQVEEKILERNKLGFTSLVLCLDNLPEGIEMPDICYYFDKLDYNVNLYNDWTNYIRISWG